MYPSMNYLRVVVWRSFSLLVLILALVAGTPHNTLAANQIETRHFTILYDEDGASTAAEIASFCDQIYDQLLAGFQAFSDTPRIVCIVTDDADLANGYAISYENSITIYTTTMDFELRGQSAWLRNVFVHEMTHLVSLKRAQRGPFNFVTIGGGKYNTNPDVDINLAWYHISLPSWFTEGIAQVGAETFGSESWDTHRDMLLRSAWLAGNLLTLDEMATLEGNTTLDAELVYNQGYSLVSFIRDRWGDKALTELVAERTLLDFDPTIKKVLGIGADSLYLAWRESLDRRYASFRDKRFVAGDLIANAGSADYHPAPSPDGQYLAWLSNRGRDHAITDLMLTDLSTGITRKLVDEVDYRISWSHDSRTLLYARRPDKAPRYYDLFAYDLATGQERRLSQRLRARDPEFSPGDSLIVFVRNEGGQNILGLMNADGSGVRFLTAAHDGTQFYTPTFSPDGRSIAFSLFRQSLDRDIALIDANAPTYRNAWDTADSTAGFPDSTLFGSAHGFRILAGSSADERDPRFLPDGSGIVFSSDRTGVFNLYRLSIADGGTIRLTDVSGGAFSPAPGSDGAIYFAAYDAAGFSIRRIGLGTALERIASQSSDRDYRSQPRLFPLADRFDVQSYQPRRMLNAVAPTFRVGPSFIGSRFGLSVIDAGAEVYLSDALGYDTLILSGSVGANLREDVSLNNSLEIYYERALSPITSSSYTHSPRFFAEASRSVINNYLNRLDARADTVYYADIPSLGLSNVLHDLHQSYTIDNEYRDEFRRMRIGMVFPVAPRHTLRFEAGWRSYRETLIRYERVRDYSSFFANGSDITGDIPGAGGASEEDRRLFTDMDYFHTGEVGLSYTYSRVVPAADNDIAPKGSLAHLQVKYLRAAITDTLVAQPLWYAPLGIFSDGSIDLGQYNPDPLADEMRPDSRKKDITEILALAQHAGRLPWKHHVVDGLVIAGYRDLTLSDSRKGEGMGYNWPLMYYLGGADMLSGYPYFAFRGTKMLYLKAGYTFPIVGHAPRDTFGVIFQRLYGTVFFETGSTWNFARLSTDHLREGAFKRDVGVELKCGTVLFYRFPAVAYARVAWPLDDMGSSPYPKDSRRWYFGLRM